MTMREAIAYAIIAAHELQFGNDKINCMIKKMFEIMGEYSPSEAQDKMYEVLSEN